MKRYIKAEELKEYEGQELEPYLVKGLMDEGDYGEREHKKYKGVGIRDFRNGWMGEDDFEELKPLMDILLEAYDRINEAFGNSARIAFFNAHNGGDGVSLVFDYPLDIPDIERYYNTSQTDGLARGRLDLHTDGTFASFNDPTYRFVTGRVDSHFNPDIIADAFIDEIRQFEAFANKSYNIRQKREVTKQNKLKELSESEEAVSSTTLTVPVSVDIDELRSNPEEYPDFDYGPIPDTTIILDKVQDALASAGLLEDANRYLKEIRVGFLSSSTTICLYPKIRYTRFRADHTGKKSSTQFDGVCRDVAHRAPAWFRDLKSRINQ